MAVLRLANVVWILMALIFCSKLPAMEPWADPRMQVRAGPELRLDAGREAAAQAAAGKMPAQTGDRLAT
jgi:hypothetical protein